MPKPSDLVRQRVQLLEGMLEALDLGDDQIYVGRLAQLLSLERTAGEVAGLGSPNRSFRLSLPAASVHLRTTPRCDEAEVATFTQEWVEAADRDRDHRSHQDPDHDADLVPGQWLAVASMYLGRAIYYTAWRNLTEARAALVKTAAMLFEAWRRMV